MFTIDQVNWDQVWVVLAAIVAAFSFVAFAIPFLKREEKKQRFQSVIEKRRKDLFMETKQNAQNKKVEKSAKEDISAQFKVQRLAGELGRKVRVKMLQAGYRSPQAPLVYLGAQICLPVLFTFIAYFFIEQRAEPFPSFIRLAIMLGAAAFGYALPSIMVKNQRDKRREEITLAFPDALDMMLICVQGGIGIEQAIDRVSKEIGDHCAILAEEMGILTAELSMLNDRKKAYHDFATRIGSQNVKSFATAMIQAEQYGTSVTQAMRVLSDDQRDQRYQNAERKAASLPPKLTVPMIVFFLPTLFIVILGPAVINAMTGNGFGG